MTLWQNLFLWSERQDTIVEAVADYLAAQAYTRYNPFGRFPGMAYPISLKTFVAPSQNGSIRVLVEGDVLDDLAAHLSHIADCLAVSLDGRMAFAHFFGVGQLLDLADGLTNYVQSDAREQFESVLNAETYDLPALNQGQIGAVPIDTLPQDMQAMAQQLNAKQADNLFQQLSQKLIKAVGQYDVQLLLQQQADWDSQGGQFIRALMSCLRITQHWREPDFSSLRMAYTLQSRQHYDPDRSLMPGDAALIATVPDALQYVPVYGGKNNA